MLKYFLFFAILIGAFLPQPTLAATITVPAGGNLQSAVNAAQPGDTIIVEAGAEYSNTNLPVKVGTAYITIQSSRAAELAEGVRVSPSQSALFARLQSIVAAEPAIKTAPGAHHYKLIGLDISTANANAVIYDLVRFGEGRDSQRTLDSVPHDLVIDRCYIHGFDSQDVQRGVSLNSAETTVSNSYISEIHGVGFDTQAIAGWNGPGPLHIINNYLEAAGENVMFGGADSASEELMPADIEIRRNYLFKPLRWKVGDPTYAGKHWTVKNLLKLKSAKHVVIDGNVMENNWVDGQDGTAVLLTVRNQECSANWSTVQGVSFTNNTVKNASGGALNFLGKDNEAEPAFGKCPAGSTSTRGSDVLIGNSLFHDIKGTFLTLNGFYNVALSRNTHLQGGNTFTLYGQQSFGFSYTNNLTSENPYGVVGDACCNGTPALEHYTPSYVFSGNRIAHPYAPLPAGNAYPASIDLDLDYRSNYAGQGADIDALNAAQSGAVGTPTPKPTPTPTPTPDASPSPTPTPAPGFPAGSDVEIVSHANVREQPSLTSAVKFIAQTGQTGISGQCLQDPASVNVYCLVNFTDGSNGYVAAQYLRVVAAPTPTPTPTPTPSPSPTATPTPSPSPSPTPSPSPIPSPSPSPTPEPCRLPNGKSKKNCISIR